MILEALFEAMDAFHESLLDELAWRDLGDWIFCFAPMLLFFEAPRYYFPLFALLIAQRLGYPRRDHEARRALRERQPLVSVVVAGRNEGEVIEATIRSLRDQDYANLEIIVVDDSSEDEMYSITRRYERLGQIRRIRNQAERGRGGRPAATNLGLRVANGEFVVSLDADTTFDRGVIGALVEGFADPRVGVVAGNVLARNSGESLVARIQALEYAVGIDLHKRWTDIWGCTLQASGAIGAFRRSAVMDVGGWEQELAEDTDVSLRMVKAGWKLAFAPRAVALTDVPTTLAAVTRQRMRWDRGGFRTYFHKHLRLFRPSVAGWAYATELWAEFVFFVLGSVLYPVYLALLLLSGVTLTVFVLSLSFVFYVLLSLSALAPVALVCERAGPVRSLILPALVLPFYKEWLRWARIKAFVQEVLMWKAEDPFLPETAWVNAPRF